ncbi:Alpha-ketoglutarate-dependent dioxygenase alkB [Capsicum chinense]|uniref:Alpha-ketoglutarate-dependent dioxygenase alkB n=1 Tax=Capsicum annuum TaxID=4072 RepID=A0A1U8GNE6_CAPAN|nr:alpha-ketoglutarate-dependent dioxygenase alkB isoform X4 [Capsicum annuum]KAF3623481.1 Alpha-ketoglutarate-dependent dioxygenase alkB [Capsicum annuum]KAF3623874.1 Alpha-ketoglutarate-dependent dioxygenase alkB [Capsicum annuum]PHT81707.1 Alpha-ketoglutarate-dependent dioxygenase alkB [Capsicum annuum]PHU17893.1 Alpha-ketoglutarate-dependent dioxygenase alkB [Capsicum chinense]
MYGSTDDSEPAAFRKAEKKYKLYYDNTRKRKQQPRPVDLSEVIDFKSISESYHRNGGLPSGIFRIQCDFDSPVFCLASHPGFYFIPGALPVEEQCRWIKESLTSFPQPPNRTNHNAIYGTLQDLFAAAKDNKVLIHEEQFRGTNNSEVEIIQNDTNVPSWNFLDQSDALSRGVTCRSVPASVLLRKLRWSTLGLQFDWSKRSYNISLPHNKIPDALCLLAERMAAPTLPLGEAFHAEAAIVNYFGLGDTLGGHVDDLEKDWNKPIVSMSLGCKGIFLIGGKSREIPPLAMFVRSGDVILMAGQARECFHGVPRIFTDREHAEISSLELKFSDEEHSAFLEYIRTSRININIRQVF